MMRYRQATRAELDLALSWAAAEGWNPGGQDADAFWACDPNGFVCAEQDGEVVATGSLVNYQGTFGFMGFFIVRPDLRGRGVGRDFWRWRRDTLLSRLQPGASIGMDGVFAMQSFYANGGFNFSHRNLRLAGHGAPAEVDPDLVELATVRVALIADYDQRHFGFARPAFISRWIVPAGGHGLGLIVGNRLAGLGVVRPCRQGFKIGPLFADTREIAHRLYAALSSHAAGQPVFLDVPENNPDAIALAAHHDLHEVFGCARMYLGSPPPLPWSKIYGITSFELG